MESLPVPATNSAVDPEATTEVGAKHDHRPVIASAQTLALGRTWVVTQIAAVAAVVLTLHPTAPLGLLVGWASFTLLNALLHLASRTGFLVGNAAAQSVSFNAALAAVFGLAWGGGFSLLLPAADLAAIAIMVATGCGVALMAIPVFAEKKGAYTFFIVTYVAVAGYGLIDDQRFPLAAAWLAVAGVVLGMMASHYYRGQSRLRAAVRTLLNSSPPAGGEHRFEHLTDDALGDLAQRKATAMDELYFASERNRRVLRALGNAVVATDAAGVIDYVNPLAEVLLGRQHQQLEGKTVEEGMRIVFPPDRRNQAQDIFDQARLTRRVQQSDDNAQLIRADGVNYGIDYVVTPIKDDQGEFAGVTFVLRDVTEKRHRQETVEWQATHDPLTGAINRSEFEIRLKKLVRRSQDSHTHTHALLYIDIDKFKFINDNYGHAAGDSALKQMSELLRKRIRGADTLARIGGDEFGALLYSCSASKARLIADGLRIAVERHPFKFQDLELPLSLSIGIVEINHECKSTAEIVRAADAACYSAKKFGRNRVHLFEKTTASPDHQARVFDFVKDIQTAIQGNRLELFYQPFYPTRGDGDPRHCELSVGIRNNQGDMIPRADVGDLAERYHLTEEIDRWAIKAAFDSLRLNHPALSEMELVMVPLSRQSTTDERLFSFVTQLVKENPAEATRVGFSFEETALHGHLDYVQYFVSTLKQHGCRFMVGDLGFGSRSIDSLKAMQADFLGIRGALVQNMLFSSVDYEVVLGLSRIARALGMTTIAEQADTHSLRDALGKMGIEYTKGQVNERPRRVAIHSEAQWI